MTKRDMATLVAAKIQRAERAIERSVWEASLDTFDGHAAFSAELEKMQMAPHEILFAKAMRYLGKADITNREHAATIINLAEVLKLAGALLGVYRRSAKGEGAAAQQTH